MALPYTHNNWNNLKIINEHENATDSDLMGVLEGDYLENNARVNSALNSLSKSRSYISLRDFRIVFQTSSTYNVCTNLGHHENETNSSNSSTAAFI